jgi:hypothetical protein
VDGTLFYSRTMPSALKDSYEALYKALNDASAADLPPGKSSLKESRMRHLSSFFALTPVPLVGWGNLRGGSLCVV